MRVQQRRWQAGTWSPGPPGELPDAQWVLVFGGGAALADSGLAEQVKSAYPNALLMGCSTAGEICDVQVTDDTLVVTAVRFDDARVAGHSVSIDACGSSFEAGAALGRGLDPDGLVHAFVLSDGLHVNGSELVAGLASVLPKEVTVTGGLSGDGPRFGQTLVMWDGSVTPNTVALVGLYGATLKVGFGSLGGWDPFGPERVITRSKGNVLYELDGRSALELYRRYLGEHAAGLPATGLLFPLSVRSDTGATGVVRTILAVDEQAQSLIFAGDVPEGAYARLMKANFDRLIDGAADAASTAHQAIGRDSAELAILISCVGRKMVLKQRIEDEVEAVRQVLGARVPLAGFYSYGEISPFTPNARCELHNQTMTITTLAEM